MTIHRSDDDGAALDDLVARLALLFVAQRDVVNTGDGEAVLARSGEVGAVMRTSCGSRAGPMTRGRSSRRSSMR